MKDKPKRPKPTRKQRQARAAARAEVFGEGFNMGYDMGYKQAMLDVERKICRHNCL
jgi:flagellar biosynthesis/type III secretory pathway protein FliH